MVTKKTFILDGQSSRPIPTDVFFEVTYNPKPIVIFCHGYKGFKDWGAWNLVAEEFAKNGFFFIKFNFSHNGGTPENPIDFPDLDAFAEDNFTKQLLDLESVIDWIITTKEFVREASVAQVNLLGHSRGGGITLLKASSNPHIKKVATWGGVSDFESRFPKGEELEKWKKDGVRYVENGRTKQQMPHNYQFYEDFHANKDIFDLKRAVRRLPVPQLIIHAKDDETVSVKEAEQLHKWNGKSNLFLIDQGGHTFGSKHPWDQEELPSPLQEITEKTIDFFES